MQKITRIHVNLKERVIKYILQDFTELDTHEAISRFAVFSPESVQEVEKIMSPPSGGLRIQVPIPTWILKQGKSEILLIITDIVNISAMSEHFLKYMKISW